MRSARWRRKSWSERSLDPPLRAAGLIRASRGSNGYRKFGADADLTVRRIARMIQLGFRATEIATFLDCIVDDPR